MLLFLLSTSGQSVPMLDWAAWLYHFGLRRPMGGHHEINLKYIYFTYLSWAGWLSLSLPPTQVCNICSAFVLHCVNRLGKSRIVAYSKYISG